MTNRSPYTGKPMELKLEKASQLFRKEEFEIVYHVYVCTESGEEFEDDELSHINYQQIVDQYREKHNIPFPEQIKTIRENYGLSARRMSDILGLGTNTWRLYEGGEVPTIANARLIQLISDPDNFLKHVTEFGSSEPREIEKIKHNLQQLKQKEEKQHLLERLFNVAQPNNSTGYSLFNKAKTEQLVGFFAEKIQPYKTALNKLLFYTDFFHFQKTGRSITGLRYVAIDFGPVPDHYNSLYEMLTDQGVVSISGTMTEFGYTERFYAPADWEANLSVFSTTERETIQTIFEQLNGKTTAEIVDLSHEEEAWLHFRNTHLPMAYTSAFTLKGIR